jgi:hypothetical protein
MDMEYNPFVYACLESLVHLVLLQSAESKLCPATQAITFLVSIDGVHFWEWVRQKQWV